MWHRIIVYSILGVLTLGWIYAAGFNEGFDSGYNMGIADVVLGEVNPMTYFLRKP